MNVYRHRSVLDLIDVITHPEMLTMGTIFGSVASVCCRINLPIIHIDHKLGKIILWTLIDRNRLNGLFAGCPRRCHGVGSFLIPSLPSDSIVLFSSSFNNACSAIFFRGGIVQSYLKTSTRFILCVYDMMCDES